MRLLLDHGADVELGFVGSSSLSYLASGRGHKIIVRLQLEHGANVIHVKNDGAAKGWSPLTVVCNNNNVDLARLLLESGADPNPAASNNNTIGSPVYVACVNGHTNDLVRLLLEHGANVNQVRKDGWASLHAASLYGNLSLVRLLIEHGANVTRCGTAAGPRSRSRATSVMFLWRICCSRAAQTPTGRRTTGSGIHRACARAQRHHRTHRGVARQLAKRSAPAIQSRHRTHRGHHLAEQMALAVRCASRDLRRHGRGIRVVVRARRRRCGVD